MKWHSVYDLGDEVPQVVGVILESEDGQIAGAVLQGEIEDPESARSVIEGMAGQPIATVIPGNAGRVRVKSRPGEPGYVESLLHALRPPLAPGPRGTVKVSAPTDMIKRVWEMVNPETPTPPIVTLG